MKTTRIVTILIAAFCLSVWPAPKSDAEPMGTAWTYQGRLLDTDSVADGLYDFQFKLYDGNDPCTSSQLGSTAEVSDLDVTDGYFTVELDFGNVFNGDARWLGISVRPGDSTGNFTSLIPRHEVVPTPYAIYAQTAGSDKDWVVDGNDMCSLPSGNVGIGTMNPWSKLSVGGDGYVGVGIYGSGTSTGVSGMNSNTSSYGKLGTSSAGVWGRGSLYGVYGEATYWGVHGEDMDTGSYGRLGDNNTGVSGNGSSTGVYGQGGTTGVSGYGGTNGVYGRGSLAGVSGEDIESGSYGRLGYGDTGVYGRNNETGTSGRLGYDTYGGYFFGDGYVSGNVGIGTTSPSQRLHIADSGMTSIFVENTLDNVLGQLQVDHGSVSLQSIYNHEMRFVINDEPRVVIDTTGNVGIGTEDPDHELHVNGTAKADKLVYSLPRTHYFSVGGRAFSSDPFGTSGIYVPYDRTSGGHGGTYIISGTGTLSAPVNLPQGAVVTEFKAFFYDNSSSDMSVSLLGLILDGGNYLICASVDSSGITGFGNKADTTITGGNIDNTRYGYNISVYSSAWDGTNMKIMGVVITYTLSEAQ